jgi:ferric-chelate reductase
MDIATTAAGSSLDLHLSIYVTCLCNPEAIAHIPNMDVTLRRPTVTTILQDLIAPRSSPPVDAEDGRPVSSSESPGEEPGKADERGGVSSCCGGVAVCASGPFSLTREAQNAVARVSMTRGLELGGIALHTEIFSF